MSGFESPLLLWLAAPGLVLWWLFARIQRRAFSWLEARVSPRFRSSISLYRPWTLRLHLFLLLAMGAALILSAAGPFNRGKTEMLQATGRLLFLVDGSASMWAEDVERPASDAETVIAEGRKYKRMDYARYLARAVMRELEGFRFALGSFSGTGVVHLPMTRDTALLERALATLEVHSYYRNTGSSFSRALDLVPHFVDRRGYRLQVVLLSDGEQPVEEDYGAQLAALSEQGVPVHTVAIGSTEGQGRRIFHFQDIVDKKENPRTLVEFHTSRVDRHLKSFSRASGGRFFVAEDGVPRQLAAEILGAGTEIESFEHQAARADRSGVWLLAFLIGLILDTLWFGRTPKGLAPRFEIGRLVPVSGSSAGRRRKRSIVASLVLAAAVLADGCTLPFGAAERGSPRELAHRENERGIGRDATMNHRAARPHYERSIGYEVEPQIPAYNLARSVALTGDYSEAHDLFQEALLLDPDLPEAHFNDGVTLYFWGRAERDPRDCDLERTRELWEQALRRFSSARAAARDSEIASRARANRAALADQIDEIDRLIANPPEECSSQSAESSAGDGGSSDQPSEGGGAGATGEGAGEGSGEGGGEASEEEAEGGEGKSGEAEEEEGEDGESKNGSGQPQEDPASPEPGEEPESEGGEGEPEEQPAAPRGPGDDPSEGGGQGGAGELSESELQEIRQQLARLAEQAAEAGKYHRRTLPEQFRKSDWSNPEATIWW
ncbi:MAG: VWA domain-containing protein [Thermoanaerobaculia bacterium]